MIDMKTEDFAKQCIQSARSTVAELAQIDLSPTPETIFEKLEMGMRSAFAKVTGQSRQWEKDADAFNKQRRLTDQADAGVVALIARLDDGPTDDQPKVRALAKAYFKIGQQRGIVPAI